MLTLVLSSVIEHLEVASLFLMTRLSNEFFSILIVLIAGIINAIE